MARCLRRRARFGSQLPSRAGEEVQMKMLPISVGTALLLAVCATANAQQFSGEEQEVWAFIERCSGLFDAGDVEGSLGCFHEDFSGWGPEDPFPRGKKNEESIGAYRTAHQTTRASEVRPFTVRVYGNFAFAHYLATRLEERPDGSLEEIKTAWTDLLLRENGRWYWIGDHGHTPEN